MNVPEQITFIAHEFNFPNDIIKEQESNNNKSSAKKDQFTTEDRESLKNAFRYITRLIFKEAYRYLPYINQIAEQLQIPISGKKQNVLSYFEGAQQISGERYFRQYISQREVLQQKLICKYMLWFLETKYLRYVSDEGKGKRKKMKKKLYIKFKNQVMMPYLQAML